MPELYRTQIIAETSQLMNKAKCNTQTLPAGIKAEIFIDGPIAAGHGESCNAGRAAIRRNLPECDPRKAVRRSRASV